MTVETTTYYTAWQSANGANKNWAYNFPILSDDSVVVHVRDTSAPEIITEYRSNFTRVEIDGNNGTIIYPATGAALSNTKQVRIVRDVPYTQETQIGAEGAFNPEIHEKAFDKLTQIAQQLFGAASRTLRLPLGSTFTELPADMANKTLAFDADGNPAAGPSVADIMSAQTYVESAEGYRNEAKGYSDQAQDYAEAAQTYAESAEGYRNQAFDYKEEAKAVFDPALYVLKSLTITSGSGIKLNGGTSATLDNTVTFSLSLAEKALSQSVWDDGVSTGEAPISPAKLNAVIAARSVLSVGTEVASTSGAAIDFTGIPSSAKRITIALSNVSITGAPNLVVQLINSRGAVVSNYVASSFYPTAGYITSTSGFPFTTEVASTNVSGLMTICKLSTGKWSAAHAGRLDHRSIAGGGTVTGAGEITGVRISANGSAFDAGSINVMWE